MGFGLIQPVYFSGPNNGGGGDKDAINLGHSARLNYNRACLNIQFRQHHCEVMAI